MPTDETRARALPVHDFPEAAVFVTPSAFRFIRKRTEVVGDKVTLIADTDDSVVVVEPKAYVPTHASNWASNRMRLRWEKPDLHEAQNLPPHKDDPKFSEKFRGMCARIHDSVYYYVDSTTDVDMQSVTDVENCPHRKYEKQRLHWLHLQLSFAKKPNETIEANETYAGENLVGAVTSLLESIKKAGDEIKHVKSSEFKSTLRPALDQCKELLRQIADLRLPPVYPRLLELTDAGPGVGVSSAECRWRLLERARIHNSDKILRIHCAREDSGQNEAERLNACMGDALFDGGSLKWQVYTPLHGLSEEEVRSLTSSEVEEHRHKNMEKNAWAVSEEVYLRIDDSPAPQGFISAFLVDKPENLFFINQDLMLQYHHTSETNKSSVPGHGYFAKLESFENNHCEKGELYMEYRKMACKEKVGELCDFCKENDFVSSEAKPTPRPYPDYKRLPEFHYLPISQTPANGRTPDDFQPRAQIKRMFEKELKPGDSAAIEKFSNGYIVSEKLVAEYIEHLSQIKIRKEKKKAETDRQRIQRKQQEYNDIDWDYLYNSDSLATLRVSELDLYLHYHKMTFKGVKKQKIAVVKAHIGSKILASIVQDTELDKRANTPPTSSDSESDIIEQRIGSDCSTLSVASDFSAGSSCHEVTEAPPDATSSRYGRKRTRVMRDNFVSWAQIDM